MALTMNGNGKPSFRKSYSIEYGYKPKKRTLIADAEFDREQHDEIKQEKFIPTKIDEEGKDECIYTILVTIKDKKSGSIHNLLSALNRDGVKIQHMETRPCASVSTKTETTEGMYIVDFLKYYEKYFFTKDLTFFSKYCVRIN